MTQNTEQDVRTRDGLVMVSPVLSEAVKSGAKAALRLDISQEQYSGLLWLAGCHPVEARGAEEQRQKDAEGQEPVVWVNPHHLPDEEYQRVKTFFFGKKTDGCTLPLYTRPANVAALEAMVQELEGALREIIDTDGSDCIHGLGPYIKIAQAALTRTGTSS